VQYLSLLVPTGMRRLLSEEIFVVYDRYKITFRRMSIRAEECRGEKFFLAREQASPPNRKRESEGGDGWQNRMAAK
jgi:hypothetical protein